MKSYINVIGIKNKMRKASELAQLRISTAVLGDSNRFIPMDTGILKASGRLENNNKQVAWNTPYAHRVYNLDESNIRKNKNPNAKPRWFEWAKSLNLKNWLLIAERTIKGMF